MEDMIWPMLCGSGSRAGLDKPGNYDGYLLEPKHDGARCILGKNEKGEIFSFSRSRKSFLGKVPSVDKFIEDHVSPGTTLDGELAYVRKYEWYKETNEIPIVDFNRTMRVLGSNVDEALRKQKEYGQDVQFIVFDVLKYEGKDITQKTWEKRLEVLLELHREWGRANVRTRPEWSSLWDRRPFIQNPIWWDVENYGEYCDVLENLGCEGVILKKKDSLYYPGKRKAKTWYKCKAEQTFDVVVMGYYEGKGKHVGRLGGIVFGAYQDGELKRIGKTGGGFDDSERQEIWDNREKYQGKVFELKANEMVGSGVYRTPRHPAFMHWRIDRTPESCLIDQFRAPGSD
ncbi:hypothetical protein [Streptomyces sp. CoH17]|uniref:ATP-dependent DNA ligase n=1 Tax=Streptomyces sp. CoH17 TaxID=2992806 RepID=UPI00226D4C4C|nr:hypothetical protein [Streptomyces sp. CoH17]